MSVRIIESIYNSSLFDEKASHPLQSWEWGEARKKMGIEVVRIGEYENNNLKNVFQMTIHKIPYTSYKLSYLPRSIFPSNEVLEFLKEYGKKNNLIFIKIEPNITKETFNVQRSTFNLIKSPHPLFPDWTMILNISKTEEDLLENMKPKTRYNIRLAQKKGVTVKEESNEKGFEIFSELYFETCKRQKYYGHNPNYHKIVWETLKNNMAHILVAYYDNTPLVAYELFHFNHVFYYPYGGSSLEYRNLMGANLIMWEAIKLGKKLGAKTFDMWGSLPPGYDQKHPWAGFTRFKEGYGAKFVQMADSFDLIVNPLLYQFYNLAHRARNIYLGIDK